MNPGLHSYEWWDGKLYLHTGSGFIEATIQEAAEALPRQVLACLSAKRCLRAHAPAEREAIVISVDSDADAEWCIDVMRGYDLNGSIKWSEEDPGGSLFFEKKS